MALKIAGTNKQKTSAVKHKTAGYHRTGRPNLSSVKIG